ncbi:MAG: hypothetical protein Q8M17_10485 [Actinomycetota bacterium]|nr:hypothetical protein [Actinomycetota bacterium]
MPRELVHDRFDGQQWPTLDLPDGVAPKVWPVENLYGPVLGDDGGVYTPKLSKPEYRALFIDWTPEGDHAQLCIAEYEPTTGEPVSGPVYLQLDRSGLNRLIRLARKARDAAFGADA